MNDSPENFQPLWVVECSLNHAFFTPKTLFHTVLMLLENTV